MSHKLGGRNSCFRSSIRGQWNDEISALGSFADDINPALIHESSVCHDRGLLVDATLFIHHLYVDPSSIAAITSV